MNVLRGVGEGRGMESERRSNKSTMGEKAGHLASEAIENSIEIFNYVFS